MTISPSFPNILTNGTPADATQVMADFFQLQNDVNANAAHNGANSDITSLTGLTTPLGLAYGGTGQTSAAGILTAIGALAAANNLSDVVTPATALANISGLSIAAAAATYETQAAAALLAPLASPALTGTPTAPTPTALDNSTKIATTAYVDKQSAKAICCFDSNGTLIGGSYNVSSVTRTSTGLFVVNFGVAFADINYIPQVSCGSTTSASGTIVANPVSLATGSVQIQTNTATTGSPTNPTRTWVAVFGS